MSDMRNPNDSRSPNFVGVNGLVFFETSSPAKTSEHVYARVCGVFEQSRAAFTPLAVEPPARVSPPTQRGEAGNIKLIASLGLFNNFKASPESRRKNNEELLYRLVSG